MNLTLGEAAKHSNRSKATLSQALKTGRLSGVKNEDGSWSIDPAELQRYNDANRSRRTPETDSEPPALTVSNGSEPPGLREELAAVRATLEAVQLEREREREAAADQIKHLRDMLAKEGEERRALSQRLLPAPETVPKPRRRLLGLLPPRKA